MRNSLRYIINASPYDYLLRFQEYLSEEHENGNCVIDAITGKSIVCQSDVTMTCKECLQKWLNEDEKESNYSEKVIHRVEIYILYKILENDYELVDVFTSACNTKRTILKQFDDALAVLKDYECLAGELTYEHTKSNKEWWENQDIKSLKVGETLHDRGFEVTKTLLRP